nr:effector binding domain-containing protein [Lampropedia puyangensis]
MGAVFHWRNGGTYPQKDARRTGFGLYHDYASNELGLYSVVAGVAVHAPDPSMASVQVAAGPYLVFTGQGPMPQTVVQTWGRVWAYFQGDVPHQRAFTTDFEAYSGTDSVAIYIAVKEK